ncbi:MAG: putative O-glycosylation ligase, exosortase A system-associated [Chromatiales bacterium]|jgi:probable O-glycosylation ligase (exosortase A-associated)
MRDIVVLIFLGVCILMSLKKAWYGVIALAIFSYLNPHAYAWGFVRTLPAYQILFLVVAAKAFMADKSEKQSLPNDWRIPAFIALWVWFFITSTQAYFPGAAWERFWFVSKIYIPFIFTLILINTREKLFYLIATIAASIGIVAFKGGFFAILSGFGHRVYGPPATQFYENNAFAVAVLINIPLVLLVAKNLKHRFAKFIPLTLPFMFASSLSSWSRGALLTLVVLTLMLLWHSKRKWLVLPLMIVGVLLVVPQLPEEWFGRMHTLETYQEDESAMSRIRTWRDGWNHTLNHPIFGAGFEGWRYVTERDWHSSYVEMFSEHGFLAFGIWLSMILGTLWSLTKLPRQTKGIEGLEWVRDYSYAIRMSLICYMVGTAFLGLSYWDLLYHLIFIAVLIKKFAMDALNSQTPKVAFNSQNI